MGLMYKQQDQIDFSKYNKDDSSVVRAIVTKQAISAGFYQLLLGRA